MEIWFDSSISYSYSFFMKRCILLKLFTSSRSLRASRAITCSSWSLRSTSAIYLKLVSFSAKSWLVFIPNVFIGWIFDQFYRFYYFFIKGTNHQEWMRKVSWMILKPFLIVFLSRNQLTLFEKRKGQICPLLFLDYSKNVFVISI